jgi:hypothetical protein
MIENLQDTSENGWNQKNEHENGKNTKKHENTKYIAKITKTS